MTLMQLSLTNEKGNIKVEARNDIRTQVIAKVLYDLGELDAVKNANGGISFPVAIDKSTNQTIYAHLALTVNMKSPDEKTVRKSKSKAKDKVETETIVLFEDEPEVE